MTMFAGPLCRGRHCWIFCRALMRRGRIWRNGIGRGWRRVSAVVKMPGGADGCLVVQGILRLRLSFASRSTTFAQDDKVRGDKMANKCKHLNQIKFKTTDTHVCEECVKMGDRWVHLRLCMVCGNVGCCDSSKNKHATKHFRQSTHPVMRSIEPGEEWIWCYVDEMVVGEVAA